MGTTFRKDNSLRKQTFKWADLHIFGDSYSVDWDIHGKETLKKTQSKYYKWLGRTPNTFRTL